MDEGSIPHCPLVHSGAPPRSTAFTQARHKRKISRSISLPVSSVSLPRRRPSSFRKQKSSFNSNISADFEPVSISADFEPVPKSAMNTMKDDELSRFVSGLDWKSLY